MNILEIKKEYDKGKKIRHSSWNLGDFCAHNRPTICLGLVDCYLSGKFFGYWLDKYQDGWEIYVAKAKYADMKNGQKFINLGRRSMKLASPSGQNIVLYLDDLTTDYFNSGCCYDYELVDEAG